MCPRVSSGDPSPRLSAWLVAAMLAMVALPAAITLFAVRSPGTLQVSSSNPTPHGYTWSLLLFIVPIVVIGFWFVPAEGVEIPRRAFWRTIGLLVPLGCGLDFFFAHSFFVSAIPGATLGIKAPALGAPVPVEEYIFYFTGFLCVLLIYVWLSEFWLAAYNVPIIRVSLRRFSSAPVPSNLGDRWRAADRMAVVYKKMFSPFQTVFPDILLSSCLALSFPPRAFFQPPGRSSTGAPSA